MVSGLLTLLIGVIVLAVVVYACHLALGMFPGLPPNVRQLVMLLVSAIGLIILIILVAQAFGLMAGGVVVVR